MAKKYGILIKCTPREATGVCTFSQRPPASPTPIPTADEFRPWLIRKVTLPCLVNATPPGLRHLACATKSDAERNPGSCFWYRNWASITPRLLLHQYHANNIWGSWPPAVFDGSSESNWTSTNGIIYLTSSPVVEKVNRNDCPCVMG